MYKIIQKVGNGGYGSVFEAKHRITKERIAIKMIHGSSISKNLITNLDSYIGNFFHSNWNEEWSFN